MSLISIELPEDIKFDIEGAQDDNDYITSCMKKFKNWEPNVTQKLMTILRQAHQNNIEGVFVDVGSCFGYFSLVAAQSNTRCLAFEPNPATFQILKRNIQLSGKGLIEAFEVGLGSTPSTKGLKSSSDNIGRTYLDNADPGEVTVEVRRMDDLAIDENIIVLKIDVEGYEPEVIRGGIGSIRKSKAEFIFLEITPKFCPIDTLVNEVLVPLWNENYLAFDIGLQDSGKMEYAIKKFKRIPHSGEIGKYLENIEQTNFLFVRKNGSHTNLTGDLWKDELLAKWAGESLEEKEEELDNASQLIDQEKKENSKLFGQLQDNLVFQNRLLLSIEEKDKIIAEMTETIQSIRTIANKIIL